MNEEEIKIKKPKSEPYEPKLKKTIFAWKFNGKMICYEDPQNPEMLICKDVPKEYLFLDLAL